jgi:cytosine/adenosine deaminase-related metal-dependent hydrolase
MDAFARWNGQGDGRVQVWFGARTPGGCTRELYREISDLARRHGMGITVHLAEVRADIAFLKARYNQGPVAFAREVGLLGPRTVLAHAVWMTDEELPALAATGAAVSHNPSSNAKLASGVAPIPAMLAAGVRVALGCDGGPSNNCYDLIREMKLAASVHKGHTLDPTVVPAEKVLEMATIDGARALGLDGEIGSLEPGKKADLVVLDMWRPHLTPSFNPVSTLVYAAMGSDVAHVMVDGRWVVRDRRLLTMDEGEIIADARRLSTALLGRAGVDLRPRWPVEQG